VPPPLPPSIRNTTASHISLQAGGAPRLPPVPPRCNALPIATPPLFFFFFFSEHPKYSLFNDKTLTYPLPTPWWRLSMTVFFKTHHIATVLGPLTSCEQLSWIRTYVRGHCGRPANQKPQPVLWPRRTRPHASTNKNDDSYFPSGELCETDAEDDEIGPFFFVWLY